MGDTLVLKGGRLFDPAHGVDRVQDVRIENGLIAEIGEGLSAPFGEMELRVRGALVTPGLVDLHVHVYPGGSTLGADPDDIGVHSGVTTVVDAGTVGAYTFGAFRRLVVEQAQTRVLSFLNFGAPGIIKGSISEVGSPAMIDADAAVRVIDAHRDVIKGVKIRASLTSMGSLGLEAIRQAKAVARSAGVPLMAHIGEKADSPEDMETITAGTLDLLENGDIVTHCFTGRVGGLFARDGGLIPEVHAARERGVRFDVGHGLFNLSFPLLRKGLELGLPFDAISTDLNRRNRVQRIFNLPVVLSRFLAVGVPLAEVVEKATTGPAGLLGMADEIGIRVGAVADLSILELLEGEWPFVDSGGEVLVGKLMLSPLFSVRSGRVCPALSSRVYQTERYYPVEPEPGAVRVSYV